MTARQIEFEKETGLTLAKNIPFDFKILSQNHNYYKAYSKWLEEKYDTEIEDVRINNYFLRSKKLTVEQNKSEVVK